jgi:hypothetical protein
MWREELLIPRSQCTLIVAKKDEGVGETVGIYIARIPHGSNLDIL